MSQESKTTTVYPTGLEILATDTIVGSGDSDYFAHEKDAINHATAEGIDLSEVSKLDSGYSRVPRHYPENLEEAIGTVFALLSSKESHPFIHSNLYELHVGMSRPEPQAEVGGVGLLVSLDRRTTAIHIPDADSWLFQMVPHTDTLRTVPDGESRRKRGAVDLRLGRSVLAGDTFSDLDVEQAVRDTGRPWEQVLAFGKRAVIAYAVAVANVSGEPRSSTEPRSRSEALLSSFAALPL